MSTDLAAVRSLKDVVAERIKSSFVELIPEEQWVAMVSKEIDDFVNPKNRNGYRHDYQQSDIQILIQEELKIRFKAMIKDELNKPEYQQNWGGSNIEPSEFIKKIIQESIPAIVTAMFGNIAQAAVNDLRTSLTGNRY